MHAFPFLRNLPVVKEIGVLLGEILPTYNTEVFFVSRFLAASVGSCRPVSLRRLRRLSFYYRW